MPVYNAEDFLKTCIDSILAQTFKNFEVICVDDGSTDKSLAILHKYEKRDSRIKVIHQSNINAGAARNNGFKYAKGEYTIFLDADDFYEAEMFEKMYQRASEVDADIVVAGSDSYLNDENKYEEGHPFFKEFIPNTKVFRGDKMDRPFSTFVGWPWDKMIRTQFIRENKLKFQEQRSTNDLFFIYACLIKARRISVVYDILIHHRTKVSSSISNTRELSWECPYFALRRLRQMLVKDGFYTGKTKHDFINYALIHLIWQLDTLKHPTKKKLYNSLKKKWLVEFEIKDKKREFFYNEYEYRVLVWILGGDYEYYLNCVIDDLRKYNKEIIMADKEIIECLNNERPASLELKKSKSYKIGLALTSLPRKIRSFIKN